MANNFFQFKQFIVRQDKCAMKVCTDSCILGAYAASRLSRFISPVKTILDIGAGTGLLSLMLAQKADTGSRIDAIEIDEQATSQMKENFSRSPWCDKLSAIKKDAATFESRQRYDLIVSNPPFYENQLRSPASGKVLARHDTGLLLSLLPKILGKNLSQSGVFFLLLPYLKDKYMCEIISAEGLFVTEKLYIRHSSKHAPFRVIISGSHFLPSTLTSKELCIYHENDYTKEFRELLADYYLHL